MAPGFETPEHVQATARESAFYQAGFEAGTAAAQRSQAAELAAAGTTLQTLTQSCISLRTGLSQLATLVSPESPTPLKKRSASQQLSSAAEVVEQLRASIVVEAERLKKAAADANQSMQLASKAFAQQIATAQAIAPKPKPQGLLARLAKAVLQGDPT